MEQDSIKQLKEKYGDSKFRMVYNSLVAGIPEKWWLDDLSAGKIYLKNPQPVTVIQCDSIVDSNRMVANLLMNQIMENNVKVRYLDFYVFMGDVFKYGTLDLSSTINNFNNIRAIGITNITPGTLYDKYSEPFELILNALNNTVYGKKIYLSFNDTDDASDYGILSYLIDSNDNLINEVDFEG